MFSDNELNRLKAELAKNLKEQADLQRDIKSARSRLEDELERVKRDWGGKLERLEDDFSRLHERIPQITSKIESRERELERDQEKKAA